MVHWQQKSPVLSHPKSIKLLMELFTAWRSGEACLLHKNPSFALLFQPGEKNQNKKSYKTGDFSWLCLLSSRDKKRSYFRSENQHCIPDKMSGGITQTHFI